MPPQRKSPQSGQPQAGVRLSVRATAHLAASVTQPHQPLWSNPRHSALQANSKKVEYKANPTFQDFLKITSVYLKDLKTSVDFRPTVLLGKDSDYYLCCYVRPFGEASKEAFKTSYEDYLNRYVSISAYTDLYVK